MVLALPTSANAASVTGTGANVTWTSGTAGDASGSGTFACGVSATVSMAAGDYNSGVAFPVDWSTSTATAGAFTGGVTPASSIAVLANSSGNAGTLSFGAEITDPVVLVAYVDPGAAIDFAPHPVTVLTHNSGAGGTPSVTGSKVTLSGPVADTVNDGWAVKVTGTFGPTSGPLSLETFAASDETFAISVASETVCPPETPGEPGQPTVTPVAGGLKVTVAAPTTGGAPTSYLATAAPGGRTCTVTGASGNCTIRGLTRTKTYTVSVVASNAGGDSSPSIASAPARPLAGSSGGDAIPGVGLSAQTLTVVGVFLLLAGWCIGARGSVLTRSATGTTRRIR